MKIHKINNNLYTDYRGKKITNTTILEYLKKLKTPPAYSNVIIYYPPNSHKLLYTGVDTAGRQQSIYSPKWVEKAKKEYAVKLAKFGKQLPKILSRIDKLLLNKKFTKQKIIAIILKIITLCHFRVGNSKYEKKYNSYGISNIQNKHVSFTNNGVIIKFRGKKGVHNECCIKDKIVVDNLKQLVNRKLPYVFMYKSDKILEKIKAIDINNWLKEFDPDFSSKMFRTFATNILLIDLMKKHNPKTLPINKRKKAITAFMKEISTIVHNTPCICRKDYADSKLVKLYIDHPRKWNNMFNDVSSRVGFVKYLQNTY